MKKIISICLLFALSLGIVTTAIFASPMITSAATTNDDRVYDADGNSLMYDPTSNIVFNSNGNLISEHSQLVYYYPEGATGNRIPSPPANSGTGGWNDVPPPGGGGGGTSFSAFLDSSDNSKSGTFLSEDGTPLTVSETDGRALYGRANEKIKQIKPNDLIYQITLAKGYRSKDAKILFTAGQKILVTKRESGKIPNANGLMKLLEGLIYKVTYHDLYGQEVPEECYRSNTNTIQALVSAFSYNFPSVSVLLSMSNSERLGTLTLIAYVNIVQSSGKPWNDTPATFLLNGKAVELLDNRGYPIYKQNGFLVDSAGYVLTLSDAEPAYYYPDDPEYYKSDGTKLTVIDGTSVGIPGYTLIDDKGFVIYSVVDLLEDGEGFYIRFLKDGKTMIPGRYKIDENGNTIFVNLNNEPVDESRLLPVTVVDPPGGSDNPVGSFFGGLLDTILSWFNALSPSDLLNKVINFVVEILIGILIVILLIVLAVILVPLIIKGLIALITWILKGLFLGVKKIFKKEG